MKSRYEGIQNKLWNMREGCFFLSLCSIAEEYNNSKIDLIDAVNMAFNNKYVTSDYTVKEDCKFLQKLTGRKVTKRVATSCGILDDNEYSIVKYLNKEKTANHFRRRYFDVYINSMTVKEGTIVSYYIYTIHKEKA